MTYPLKFRQQVLRIKEEEGLTYGAAAKRFGIGLASVMRWVKKPEPVKKRNKGATKIDMAALAEDVLDYPDAYQYERAERLGANRRSLCDALRRLKVSRKKNT